ncbi:MAG: alpha/beta fold hydrolase [Allosphingosinicella sp.]
MRIAKTFGAALLLLAGQAPAAAAPPKPIPIEALAERPFIADPVLSPDGRWIAARVYAGDATQLAIYDLKAARDTPPTIVPGAGNARWFSWAGSDRLLIGQTLFTLVIGAIPLSFTRLDRYELSTKKMLSLETGGGVTGDDVIFTDPEGRYLLLSAQKDLDDSPSVHRVDLATGTSVEIQKKQRDIWNWVSGSAGNIRLGISYGDNGRWTVYRRDPASGALRKLAKGKQPEPDSAVDSIAMLPGSESGVIVTNERTGRFGVYQYDLRTATVGEAIFEHPRVDVTLPIVSADGTGIAGVSYEDETPQVRWIDPALGEIQAQVDRTFPGKVNRLVSRNRDDSIILIWTGSADDPGAFYVFDRKARRMDAFAAPHEKLAEVKMAAVKPVRYRARDGVEIPGYLTLPQGREAKGLPLIVMPHGGPFHRTSYSFDPWVQLLADRGYAVLQPNFRGSTGYGRAFVERGYGQMGLAMQDDLDDGVAWLAEQGTIDPKRVCLVGASYGGYAALWGAIRNPEKYRCAVSFAGVTDIRAVLKHNARMFVASRYSKLHRRKIEGEEKRDLAAVSPLQQAARLRVPVLLAHGERDTTVPAEQSRKLFAALRAKGIAVQGAFYPGSGHDLERAADGLDFMRRMEAFLELHNPPSLPADAAARAPRPVSALIAASELDEGQRKKSKRQAVDIAYRVAADGRVEGCSVTQSSGVKALDQDVCRIAEERFQYRPALSAAGVPEPGTSRYSLSWAAAETTATGTR